MEHNVKDILEIGRFNGISTKLFALIARENNGHLISIDQIAFSQLDKTMQDLGLADYVTFIDQWSPWIDFSQIKSIDFLFIDGNHSFMSVITDYHVFSHFLKIGGFIAFHDTNLPDVRKAIEVIQKRDSIELCPYDGLIRTKPLPGRKAVLSKMRIYKKTKEFDPSLVKQLYSEK